MKKREGEEEEGERRAESSLEGRKVGELRRRGRKSRSREEKEQSSLEKKGRKGRGN